MVPAQPSGQAFGHTVYLYDVQSSGVPGEGGSALYLFDPAVIRLGVGDVAVVSDINITLVHINQYSGEAADRHESAMLFFSYLPTSYLSSETLGFPQNRSVTFSGHTIVLLDVGVSSVPGEGGFVDVIVDPSFDSLGVGQSNAHDNYSVYLDSASINENGHRLAEFVVSEIGGTLPPVVTADLGERLELQVGQYGVVDGVLNISVSTLQANTAFVRAVEGNIVIPSVATKLFVTPGYDSMDVGGYHIVLEEVRVGNDTSPWVAVFLVTEVVPETAPPAILSIQGAPSGAGMVFDVSGIPSASERVDVIVSYELSGKTFIAPRFKTQYYNMETLSRKTTYSVNADERYYQYEDARLELKYLSESGWKTIRVWDGGKSGVTQSTSISGVILPASTKALSLTAYDYKTKKSISIVSAEVKIGDPEAFRGVMFKVEDIVSAIDEFDLDVLLQQEPLYISIGASLLIVFILAVYLVYSWPALQLEDVPKARMARPALPAMAKRKAAKKK
ncbi:MAG: hypothetical protein JW834_01790 [Candidatus Diapherotrites archaeon]|nr:hypothetical protein [Candidatus Diapherotrites archaeon]